MKKLVFALQIFLLAGLPAALNGEVAPGADVQTGSTRDRAAIERFVSAYVRALESLNPLRMAVLCPDGSQVAASLIEEERFDQLASSRWTAEITGVSTRGSITVVRLERAGEELFSNGLFLRSFALVELHLMQNQDGLFKLVAHSLVPPSGAPDYRPSDPDTWPESLYEKSEILLARAFKERNRGRSDLWPRLAHEAYTAAAETARKFQMPDSYFRATLLFANALAFVEEGRKMEAMDALSAALVNNPRFPLALNLKAKLLFAEGSQEQAILLWKQSLAADPRQHEIQDLLELLALAAGIRIPELEAALKGVVEVSSGQAVDGLRPFLEAQGKQAWFAELLARLYLADGNPQAALETLRRLPPVRWTVECHYLQARALLAAGERARAIDEFAQIWSSSRGYRDAPVFLVELLASAGRFSELRSLAKGMELARHPAAPGAEATLGLLAHRMGKDVEAATLLRAAAGRQLPAGLRAQVNEALAEVLAQEAGAVR